MKNQKKQPRRSPAPSAADPSLGDFLIKPKTFGSYSQWGKEFNASSFQKLNEEEKRSRVNQVLLKLIEKEKGPCFLLPAILDYVAQINQKRHLETYAFSHFELWLNQFSSLTREQNLEIRAKIVGKWVPRDEYQSMFPIGMGKTYPGSHFVTAHGSPDLDTTIASFWGWIDAFGARVSENLHFWNIPGGPPLSQIEIHILFQQIFGESIFEHLNKSRTSLFLSSLELMTQRGLVKKQTDISTLNIDHGPEQHAVVLVDDRGYYLGDWRSFDVESVRQVIMLFNQCLRWFVSDMHVQLIAFFGKSKVSLKDLSAFSASLFNITLEECEPVKEFSYKQRAQVHDYLQKVLKIPKGLESSFKEFAQGLKRLKLGEFEKLIDDLESLHQTTLFDRKGQLVEDRPAIFAALEKIIRAVDHAIVSVRRYVERLDVALNIKTEVFGTHSQQVSYRADVDELRSKMGDYSYLTVTSTDPQGKQIPLGIVLSSDVHKPILGTVTLRDFCNRDETKIPPYFEVISVIDHHKSALNTLSAPVCIISDSQSSNVLCAELAFAMNDRFSLGGMSLKEIETQMRAVEKQLTSASQKRVFQKLLQRYLVAEHGDAFFVDPLREYVEYLHFLFGILDDTDLLTKISQRDVICVASLLNRMKSLMLRREVEVISFDDLPRDKTFVSKAAKRLLQHPDLYSLYRKIYLSKEEGVERHFEACAKGEPSAVFVDTKVQNGCARVGQTKMFSSNVKAFLKYRDQIRAVWHKDAVSVVKERPEIDLHMHMISTVAGAEDLFKGKDGDFSHQDELWLWIPFTEQSIEHLRSFLNHFKASPQLVNNPMKVEFFGSKAKEYEKIFDESFGPVAKESFTSKGTLSIAVLKYQAGSINSRKAVISPCLPKLSG